MKGDVIAPRHFNFLKIKIIIIRLTGMLRSCIEKGHVEPNYVYKKYAYNKRV